jgi:Protein of unknown function (DUF2516)
MSPLDVTGWIVDLIWFIELGIGVFAFVDTLRHRKDAFVAAGKRTKGLWLGITGMALLLILLAYPFQNAGRLDPLNLLVIVAVVASSVYLADVRPAVSQMRGRGGGGGRMGPYGPW